MQDMPDCLIRRCKALDELVKELSAAPAAELIDEESAATCNDPGVRLMCDFWNILKENPDCNLTRAVRNRIDLSPKSSMFRPQRVTCYMATNNGANNSDDSKKSSSEEKPIKQCCHKGSEQTANQKSKCCSSKSVSSSQASSDVLPLSKVLCDLKEAASFDRKCQGMVNDLMSAQKHLQDQIQHLEHREAEGIELLKKADCMWSCMEDAYKKKIHESQDRQQELIKQFKEAEANTNRWRKNKKDLEFQMENVNTCHQEISDKLQQKQNDLKCMNRDIADFKKRTENNKKELDAAKKSVYTKKNASNDRIKKISEDIYKTEARIREEKSHKEEKELEGNQYIREARADLLNLSKILLQKKIENEDFKIRKETLIDELEILSQSYDQCKNRCQYKKKSIEDEIKNIDGEILNYQAKCLRCHQCTDTIDIRKFCTDCPRCLEERECLYKEDHCSPDHTMDCVCMSVKQKFLDNVFENMYTVLERQSKTGPGKCVAETVLNCLKKSRNGKLDQQTRQILQDFILTTVKKNLNLTIVGGAVKTRCELDSETYKQLMLCLKQVKAVRPPKADKQTAAKKPPCSRWGGESECNCPKGPKACICTKRAPPPPNEPGPCPPQDEEDKGEVKTCPYKESAACGPDCAMHAVPSAVATDIAAWRPDPCQGPICMFKNMRAAQCVLGPESLNTMYDSRSFVTGVPYTPNITTGKGHEFPCMCGSSSTKPCTCKDIKQMKVDTRTQCDDQICGMISNSLHGVESSTPTAKSHNFQNNASVDKDYSKSFLSISKSNQSNPIERTVDNKLKADLIKEQFEPVLITKSFQNNNINLKNINKKLIQNNVPTVVEPPNLGIHKEYSKSYLGITKSNQSNPAEKTVDNKLKADLIKEQFQPLLITKSFENKNNILENSNKKLIQNNVPTFVEPQKIEIDEEIVELIENITSEDPSSFVSLKKTKSGHLTLGLNSVRDEDGQSIVVKRSPSGNMIIEIEKNILHGLTSDKCKMKLCRNKTTKTENIDKYTPKLCIPQCSKIRDFSQNSVKKMLLHNFKEDFSVCKSIPQTISKNFLKNIYKRGCRSIKIIFKCQQRKQSNLQATLLQMSSENIAIHTKNLNIVDNRIKFPVLLQKTGSGTINIDSDVSENSCNGVAIRTASNGFLIYVMPSNSQELEPLKDKAAKTQDVFKIKIKGLDIDMKEPPVVIKRTPSGNYDVVLEKEYEKYFQETIRHQTVDESESFFDLTKTSSSVILDFDKDNNRKSHSQRALLMKSNSGLLKIIVSDATQTAKEEKGKRSISMSFGSTISAKALGELLRKLPSASHLQKSNINVTGTQKTKSSSDSQLYETAKIKLHSNQSLLEKSSTTLKKTPSGQYAVILDKDLKKSFINNLLSYLDKSSKGEIPIKRTDSGEITISFDKNTIIGECESLKISPSGNIYIIVDEKNIKRISNNVAVNTSYISDKNNMSQCVSKIDNSENKAIATNCNADPKDSLCDSSKCICDRSNMNNKKDSMGKSRTGSPTCSKLCDKSKCCGLRDKHSIKSNNKSPHIIIRSCESRPEPDSSNKFQESYYCEVQSVCPYHKDCSEDMSNEFLEIHGLPNKTQKKVLSKVKTHRKIQKLIPENNVNCDWNSFDYLPHQLPPFLRNFTYS